MMSEIDTKNFIAVHVKETIQMEVRRTLRKVIAWSGFTLLLTVIGAVISFQQMASQTIENTKDIKLQTEKIDELWKVKADLSMVLEVTKRIEDSQREGYQQIKENQSIMVENQKQMNAMLLELIKSQKR